MNTNKQDAEWLNIYESNMRILASQTADEVYLKESRVRINLIVNKLKRMVPLEDVRRHIEQFRGDMFPSNHYGVLSNLLKSIDSKFGKGE
jgi:hypothetical protein